MTDSLQQLKFLTESLPSFPGEASEASPGVKIHEMKSGTSIAWDLLSLPEISVARWFNSASTIFPEHIHEQREWIIIYKGSMTLHLPKQPPKRLLPGMSVTIEPNTPHRATFMEDCWYMAITIPSSDDWPVK